MLDKATLDRLNRGLTGLSTGLMRIVAHWKTRAADGKMVILWEVESQMSSRLPKTYYVGFAPEIEENQWRCTCPDYQKRHRACKHILIAQLAHQQRVEVVR